MITVEFVCLGNICRSPMAEGIFRQLVEEAGLTKKIAVRSAATGSWNLGKAPHRGTQQVLKKHGIDYTAMKATKLTQDEIADTDYLIGMDEANLEDIRAIAGSPYLSQLAKLMDFVEHPEKEEIPDPYYTGDFDETERLVLAGCKGLLEKIKSDHRF
ncbi:low molecular weight protein-tyrosine-phosphatase [Listeria costaricensis]|uniref:low molecular weight protein-tyrosine-phosphatase n=1 Tax=Listeria costaricensis TaxID=2026604 RepID=UPI000C07433B|nr:low molecular weight protein-tyrosine-phosphatase [Listeria costaricensis]